MAFYSTNEFRSGLKIMLENHPCEIVENEFVKPGKGQAFNRVKFRNLITGRTWERTMKSGESLEAADVFDKKMQYLYNDGESWCFMDEESFEQVFASAAVVADCAKWLKEEESCVVTLWNGEPISVLPPQQVILKVTETDPGLRGDTATGGTKPATVETGAVLKVPLFIEQGDLLKINARTGEYISRAKE